jgi:hypothetical protein
VRNSIRGPAARPGGHLGALPQFRRQRLAEIFRRIDGTDLDLRFAIERIRAALHLLDVHRLDLPQPQPAD